MSRSFQLSLLGTGQGKGFLFGKGVLAKYLDQHRTTAIPGHQRRVEALRNWINALSSTDAPESVLEQSFVGHILCDVLGYTAFPAAAPEQASLYPKPGAKITGIRRVPDAALGVFQANDFTFTAVVELKTPGTGLDEPQPRDNNESPVQQGFYYGERILGVRWVLVTDMRIIRLYSVRSSDEYEEFDLTRCVDPTGGASEFRRLHFLLHHDYLIKSHEGSQVARLYAKSSEKQIEIRKWFYSTYYSIRADLFEALSKASKAIVPRPTHEGNRSRPGY